MVGDPRTSHDPEIVARGPRKQSPWVGRRWRYRFFFAFALLVFFGIALARREASYLRTRLAGSGAENPSNNSEEVRTTPTLKGRTQGDERPVIGSELVGRFAEHDGLDA